MRGHRERRLCSLAAAIALSASWLLAVPGARADFASDQPKNFSKTQERRREFDTPEYRTLQAQIGSRETAALAGALARDPERDPRGNLCATHVEGCQGDARLYYWQERGFGISMPVLFTAADGATLSGHVWATRDGPRHRPGIVIATGSLGSPEQFYWWAATTLAKDGYVVLTFDVQGQGQSDTYGEGADRMTHVPAEPEEASYTTSSYLDGIRNALDFLVSRPSSPYEPSSSPVTGTSHRDKQDRRAGAGLDARYNPLWALLDGKRIGVAGHSTGAQTAEQVSRDPRVRAAVLWDDVDTGGVDGQLTPNEIAGPPRVPVLEFGADYGIPAVPYAGPPDPSGRTTISRAYSSAGIDNMAVNIRGGTHLEWSYIPDDAFSATLRGMDMSAWYTQAWFDKYVKGDSTADSRLLTNRWLSDRPEAAVDPNHDGNMFSSYYRSRLDIRLAGGRHFLSEDMRSGRGLAPDCEPIPFSYIDLATSPDKPRAGGTCPVALAGSGARCLPRRLPVSGGRIGPARLGRSFRAFFRRYRAVRRGRAGTRFCVRGGGRFLVGARRGKIDLVASTARGHRTRRLGPGHRIPRAGIAGTHRLEGSVFVGHRAGGGRVLYGVARGRVRFLAVASRRELLRPRSFVRRLQTLGLVR